MKTVQDYIRTIVDFPHEGIMFRDVTTLFADPRGFRMAIDQMLHPYAGMQIDKVVGLEARGFILGGAIAHQLSVGFVPIRKKGKLPGATISQAYTLEYGEAVVELHDDAIQAGEKILVVDDLLATGGTAEAGIKLIERLGGRDRVLRLCHRPARSGRATKARSNGHGCHRALRVRGALTHPPAQRMERGGKRGGGWVPFRAQPENRPPNIPGKDHARSARINHSNRRRLTGAGKMHIFPGKLLISRQRLQ